jgi:LEA14-like dessication related protein
LADGAALAETRHMRMLAVATAVSMLSGCSLFLRSMEKPTATVRDVSVTSAGFTGVTGQLQLDVMNPNSFGVPLAGIDWTLSIGNARAVTGSVQLSQTIPAKAVAPVTTTLSISTSDALAVAGALAAGARDYRVDVRLQFSTQVGRLDVAVQHSGQLGTAIAAR